MVESMAEHGLDDAVEKIVDVFCVRLPSDRRTSIKAAIKEALSAASCAIVPVPEQEISDLDLGLAWVPNDSNSRYTHEELEAIGVDVRKELLKLGHHVTRVVGAKEAAVDTLKQAADKAFSFAIAKRNELVQAWIAETGLSPSETMMVQQTDGNAVRVHFERIAGSVADREQKSPDDYRAQGYDNTLSVVAKLFSIEWQHGRGIAQDLVDAICAKFNPEKTLEEQAFEKDAEQLLLQLIAWTDYPSVSISVKASVARFRDTCDPVALARGELKAKAQKKGPTLEELRAREYAVHITRKDKRYLVKHELGYAWWDDDREIALRGMDKVVEDAFAKAVANDEDLPMPGGG